MKISNKNNPTKTNISNKIHINSRRLTRVPKANISSKALTRDSTSSKGPTRGNTSSKAPIKANTSSRDLIRDNISKDLTTAG